MVAGPLGTPSPSSTSASPAATQTVTVHEHDTALLIVPAVTYTPFTVTRTLIRVASRSTYTSTSTVVATTSSSRPTPAPTQVRASWSLPADFTKDFSSAFGVNRWAWGASLVTPLPGIPTTITPVPQSTLAAQNRARPSIEPAPNAGPVMQVRFPQGSINPGGSPQGGVGFYASPSRVMIWPAEPLS